MNMNKHFLCASLVTALLGMGAAASAVAGERAGLQAAGLHDPVHNHRDHYRGEAVHTQPRAHQSAVDRDPVHNHRDYYRGQATADRPGVKPGSATRDAELFYELYERS